MYQSTHASMGQNPEQAVVPSLQATRAGSSPTPSSSRCARETYVPHHSAPPANPLGPPPSALRPPRLGISLTEVLIAMGILTIGLLGVASIFPVASFYMQQGDKADRGSQIAQSAFNDAVSRGTLDPERWLMLQDTGATSSAFTKPFAQKLRDEIALQSGITPPPSDLVKNRSINARFGSAYIIDPLGTSNSPLATDPNDPRQARYVQTFPFNTSFYINMAGWWPWNPAGSTSNLTPKWPLVRVTLPQVGPTGNFPMTQSTADHLFRSIDDLAIDVPTQSNRPSTVQMATFDLDTDGKQDALSRQSRGDYSWMATLVPSGFEARNALAFDPSAHEYEVSVAVFHKRVIDNFVSDTRSSERVVQAKVVSRGLSGGEVLLEAVDSQPEPFVSLKSGNWVMLCGPSPTSTNERPQFVARWYRILSIVGKDSKLDSNGNPSTNSAEPDRRLLALRGPQWPWEPDPSGNLGVYPPVHLSNALCVAIVPGVVAVHSKTIKLGGRSSWSVQ